MPWQKSFYLSRNVKVLWPSACKSESGEGKHQKHVIRIEKFGCCYCTASGLKYVEKGGKNFLWINNVREIFVRKVKFVKASVMENFPTTYGRYKYCTWKIQILWIRKWLEVERSNAQILFVSRGGNFFEFLSSL